MNEETFDGAGGLKIFTRVWRPEGKARGVVVINHGFKSHGGLYEWAATQLVGKALAVYALDMRGHGKSEGELTEHLGGAELGKRDQHGPLAGGVGRAAEHSPRREPTDG